MTQRDSGNNMDPFEPWRALQGANVQIWANMMAEALRTDRLSQAMTNFFDTYLAASTQFQNTIDQYMHTAFPRLNVPVRSEVADVSGRIARLEQALISVETRTVEQLDGLPAQLADLKQRTQALPEQLATLDQELRSLPDRISNLEQRFQGLSDQLNNVDQSLQAMPDRINNLEQRFQGLPEQLSAVDQRVQAVPDRFATLERRLDDLAATIDQQVQSITGQLAESSRRQQETDSGRGEVKNHLQALQDTVTQLRESVEALRTEQPATTQATSGRRRRGTGAG